MLLSFCVQFMLWLLGSMAFFACGSAGGGSSLADEVHFYLESEGTNNGRGAIIFEKYSENMKVSLLGEGVQSSNFAIASKVPINNRIEFYTSLYGEYIIEVIVYLSDGTEYVRDTFVFKYSLEQPDQPIVGFSEKITSDDLVNLLVSSARSVDTKEIFVSGDLAESEQPAGSWRDIPGNDTLPIKLSEEDGEKKLLVMLRNVYGNVSKSLELSILKHSPQLEDCRIELASKMVNESVVRIFLGATDTIPVSYRVMGDVPDILPFEEITEHQVVEVPLQKGEGQKEIIVQIKNDAETFCEPAEVTLTVDKSYEPIQLDISAEDRITTSRDINLDVYYDKFEHETVEMYISGDIESGENVESWIPYAESIPIKLSAKEGVRNVYAKFRKGEVVSDLYQTQVYLNPFIYIKGDGPVHSLSLSNLLGLDSLTIAGCQESYEAIEFAANIPCTPSAANISVTYHLTSGTDYTVSAAVP